MAEVFRGVPRVGAGSDRVVVEIRGVDQIIKNLNNMVDEVRKKQIKKAANKGIRMMKEEVQLNAERMFWRGYSTGNLAAGVRTRVDRTTTVPGINEGRMVYFKTGRGGASHWHLLEFGTGPRYIEGTGKYPAGTYRGIGPAIPFVRPAYEKMKVKVADTMADILAEPVKKKRPTARK